MLFLLWKTGIMHCYVVASFHSFKSYGCILWSAESRLFRPTAVDCGWCVARTHCIYVDQYVLSAPNLLRTYFSVGFQKRYVTPCNEHCSIQKKQIVVHNVCEVCIILPIIALIISFYVNQYFICLLLEYCTWNDPFIFGDWRKLTQGVPLPTKSGISLMILKPMKILQRDLNRSTFVVWEMKRNVSVVCVCFVAISSLVLELLKKCRVW